MTNEPTPDDYDIDDGFDEDAGLEQCPHCETTYSINSSFYGPVWDASGTEYELYTESVPGDGPFFCEDCWTELRVDQKQQENATLGEF